MKAQAALKSANFRSRAIASRSGRARHCGRPASAAVRSSGESFCIGLTSGRLLERSVAMAHDSMPLGRFGAPPSAEDIGDMADHALAAIPARLRQHVRGVAILVEEVADDDTLAELDIENAWELTGL